MWGQIITSATLELAMISKDVFWIGLNYRLTICSHLRQKMERGKGIISKNCTSLLWLPCSSSLCVWSQGRSPHPSHVRLTSGNTISVPETLSFAYVHIFPLSTKFMLHKHSRLNVTYQQINSNILSTLRVTSLIRNFHIRNTRGLEKNGGSCSFLENNVAAVAV